MLEKWHHKDWKSSLMIVIVTSKANRDREGVFIVELFFVPMRTRNIQKNEEESILAESNVRKEK